MVLYCLILFCFVLPCLVVSYLLLSWLIWSRLILSCLLVLFDIILYCLVLSCVVLSCLLLSCNVLAYMALSCYTVLFCLQSSSSRTLTAPRTILFPLLMSFLRTDQICIQTVTLSYPFVSFEVPFFELKLMIASSEIAVENRYSLEKYSRK